MEPYAFDRNIYSFRKSNALLIINSNNNWIIQFHEDFDYSYFTCFNRTNYEETYYNIIDWNRFFCLTFIGTQNLLRNEIIVVSLYNLHLQIRIFNREFLNIHQKVIPIKFLR